MAVRNSNYTCRSPAVGTALYELRSLKLPSIALHVVEFTFLCGFDSFRAHQGTHRTRGNGLTDVPVGSLRNVYLVVTDLEAVRNDLLERGVDVGEIRHKTPIGAWDGGFASGLDPSRGDYASFANFSDSDGNSWMLQEGGYRNVS